MVVYKVLFSIRYVVVWIGMSPGAVLEVFPNLEERSSHYGPFVC